MYSLIYFLKQKISTLSKILNIKPNILQDIEKGKTNLLWTTFKQGNLSEVLEVLNKNKNLVEKNCGYNFLRCVAIFHSIHYSFIIFHSLLFIFNNSILLAFTCIFKVKGNSDIVTSTWISLLLGPVIHTIISASFQKYSGSLEYILCST